MNRPLTLDDLLADPHFRACHERHIAASPAAVWAALHDLRLVELPVARVLMAIRALPARALGGPPPSMMTARLLEDGPVPVLASEPGRSVVAAGVRQPWKLTGGGEPPTLDVAELQAFDEPGWVKAGMNFVLEPDQRGTLLRTETRVVATDNRTRVRFGLYWLAIRAGSGLIRRDLLRQVASRSETDGGGAPPRMGFGPLRT